MIVVTPCTEVVIVARAEFTESAAKKFAPGWFIRRGTVVASGGDRVCVVLEGNNGRVTFVDALDVFSGELDNYDGLDEARYRAQRDKGVLYEYRKRKCGMFLDISEDFREGGES